MLSCSVHAVLQCAMYCMLCCSVQCTACCVALLQCTVAVRSTCPGILLQVLNVSTELSAGIFRILSAILWIGNLEFEDSDSEACQLAAGDLRVVGKVAKLLGLSEAQVRKVCTIRQISVKGTTTDIALKYHEV